MSQQALNSGLARHTNAVRLQAILRRINDEIAEQAVASSADPAFVCECTDRACVDAIEVPLELYRRLRLVSTRFAVRSDHVDASTERVVAGSSSYAVVERSPLPDGSAKTLRLAP